MTVSCKLKFKILINKDMTSCAVMHTLLAVFLGQVKKIRCFSSPPASFFAAASFFLLFTIFNTNLYIVLVVVQKMYIQPSNSFGHRSAERILPYENERPVRLIMTGGQNKQSNILKAFTNGQLFENGTSIYVI